MPLNLDEHVSMCDFHLVYLGFGAFLCLVPRLALDTKEFELLILGQVVGEDPETHIELTKKAIKEEKINEPKSNTATAAAGSTHQLPRVERELSMPPTKSLDSPSTSSSQHSQTSQPLQAICKPLSISLTRLRKSEIMKSQCTNIKAKPDTTSCVKPCKVKIWNLSLRYDQTVQLKQFSHPDQERKLVLKKPTQKFTQTQCKSTVKNVKCHVHVFKVQRHILKNVKPKPT